MLTNGGTGGEGGNLPTPLDRDVDVESLLPLPPPTPTRSLPDSVDDRLPLLPFASVDLPAEVVADAAEAAEADAAAPPPPPPAWGSLLVSLLPEPEVGTEAEAGNAGKGKGSECKRGSSRRDAS